MFNVATIFHGEEAVLAAVFLFTVHFFNNHFRPDKFPLDTVMFTGAVSLEEFQREHAVEYDRLVETGQLERHRVPAAVASLGPRFENIGLYPDLGRLDIAGPGDCRVLRRLVRSVIAPRKPLAWNRPSGQP